MFYVASKLFWLVAQPLSLVLLLAVLGIILVILGRRRLGVSSAALGAIILVLGGFTSLGFILIQPLENSFTRPELLPQNVSTIIVLGGSTLARVSTARDIVEFNDAGDRLSEAVRLARQYPQARIVFTGGVGMMEPAAETEAATAERYFLAMGIDPARLVLESASRNTDENAELTAEMLGESTGVSLLVTSAFHMPRSIGLFRRVGLDVVAWPVDYRSTGSDTFGIDIANPMHNFNTLTIAVREWIGLAVYNLTGRIDSMLPRQASN